MSGEFDPNQALEFVNNVRLTEARVLENDAGEPLNLVPPEFFEPKDQTVTVGSQLAGFAAGIDAELRQNISNAFLLAQLAANRRIEDTGGSPKDWYKMYISVLTNIGWTLEGNASAERDITGTTLQVHEQIIPVITAALGPAASAASTIISILNGLKEMNKDTPWITLFHRESQRVRANQFQVSYATKEGMKPRITLLGFEFEAEKSVTQVLFFTFGSSEAKLKNFEVKLSLDEDVFAIVKDQIKAKIANYITGYVSDIEI